MIDREKKTKIVENIQQSLKKAEAVFVTNLVGISSNEANTFRRKVRLLNGDVVVARNTLFKLAAKGTSSEQLLSKLKGPTTVAIAFKDAASVAKVIFDTGKDQEKVTVGPGVLGTQALSSADVTALAKLPSRDQMLGTVLATFLAPVSAFARVLQAIKEKKENPGN